MPPPPFRDAPSSAKSSQRYTPLHESTPEDLNDKQYGSDADSLPLSDPSDGEDDSEIKLRRVDRNGTRRNHAAAYVPVVRKSGDVEAYLDSIAEAELELLSASRQYDGLDDDDDDSDGYGVAVKRGQRQGLLQRTRDGRTGWRTVYYSKYWWRALMGVVVVLVLLVLVFLSLAWSKQAGDELDYSMIPAESWFPTPRGGALKEWAADYQKAALLVGSMTLIEKVNITTGTGWRMGLCVGNTGPAESVHFPSLCLQDGPMGIRYADHISAFPPGLTTGATWNRDLIRERGAAMGLEARLKGVNVLLGPSMGPLGMMPAGGRNWEAFGSDPVLQGVAAAETIKGIQSNGVMATAKHFVMNEQEHFRQPFEWGIPTALSSNVGDRALHEVFAWPFAESIRADVASVMCAYQMVNNSHACENSKLLNGILKDELGFQGFVQSDWLAQRSGINSALGGLDMSMPGDGLHWADGKSLWGSELTRAVLNTSIPMERLNDMVTRIVAAWYHLGQDQWERPPPDGEGGPNFSSWTDDQTGWWQQGSVEAGDQDGGWGIVNKYVDAGAGHGDIARKVAAEGIVLVKNNNNTLPLSRNPPSPYRIGIYGDDAGPALGPNACPDRGCSQGTLASGWGSGTVEFPFLVSPLEALQGAWETEVEITPYLQNMVMPVNVQDKDLCLVFANANSGEGYITAGGIHGDRNDLFLQKGGDTLIQAVASNCPGPTVVVVHAVGPVVVESWIDLPGVDAVLFAHLPGQESGNALVDVLFGDVDASGRLPYTVGKSLEDYGPGAQVLYENNAPVPQVDFLDALYIDYRYFDKFNITPRYEFGFGLSYTTFELSKLYIKSMQRKSRLPKSRPQDPVSPPEYDTHPPVNENVLFPEDFHALSKYVYSYLPSLDGTAAANYTLYPDGYDLPRQPSEAGGGLGGNPSLYEEMAKLQVQVANTGARAGQTVVQAYVSFPSDVVEEGDLVEVPIDEKGESVTFVPGKEPVEFPDRVLRNFTKIALEPGEKKTVEMTLSRKDLSYWSARQQNWVMPDGDFQIWVGQSSRDLPLHGKY
ncbi:putative beta-glucosidase E [Aspergillus parasiticus]|uniref:Probable beta-glucosidase E n=1 Tax=Aspergillus parasiticus TaxID=5067 RepID=A0A5N6DZT1_ASPPA|nr:putative beta-glucosidase E [Aspergillus parasiticus]